ncbi:hypothetical protein NEFER03_1636 [Nematocida sp. LUAm3]|nr:hypothetical protein NEFER03_1636 [Nematocida sp. LUAm3]KAI5176104.1 hypothetical protein NEFER02_1925 [Nematocida sp. LUAm2]KAI5178992.1 hypothetical protein NEFER01_1868 [Nematocida sp. LUAm1]
MEPLEEDIFGVKPDNLKHSLHSNLSNNRIEEIILKSIDDQDTLFSQPLFQEELQKEEYPSAYTKEIIDMCSEYILDDPQYAFHSLDSDSFEKIHRTHSPRRDKSQEKKKNKLNEGRPFICTYSHCFKAFKRFEHLKRHYRIHTGEKPYKCLVYGCNKTFSRSDNLMQHSKIHMNRKQ